MKPAPPATPPPQRDQQSGGLRRPPDVAPATIASARTAAGQPRAGRLRGARSSPSSFTDKESYQLIAAILAQQRHRLLAVRPSLLRKLLVMALATFVDLAGPASYNASAIEHAPVC